MDSISLLKVDGLRKRTNQHNEVSNIGDTVTIATIVTCPYSKRVEAP